jgi:hypothetical protein
MPTNSKKQITKVPATEVKEVSDFLDSLGRLETFRAKHAEVFAEFETLVNEYNQKLEDAERTCRQRQIACGPFDLYNYSVKYDPKALFDMVGHDRFLELGGTIGTESTYAVDKKKLEIKIQQGELPDEVVDGFKKVSPSFHTPEKIIT